MLWKGKCENDLTDKLALQRNLGVIEGAMLAAPTEVQILISGAVETIDEILWKEEITDDG